MKAQILLFGAALGFWLTAGCGANEPIYFVSEARIPAAVVVAASASRNLSKAEEEKIDGVVFSYLLDRHFWEDGNYTALFLQADDAVVAAMMKKYPRHHPPIKKGYHINLRSNQSPLDRDTGKPVMILGVDVGDPDADGRVDVIGRWYAGGAVQGFYTFKLKKTGDDWPIVAVK
jgi:hypothetical protein